MKTTNEELISQALLGDEAKKFMESDLGRCLVGMANQEAEAALLGLAEVNPTDVQAIERLQNRARLGKMFEAFLRELIEGGENALIEWKQQNPEQDNNK